MTLHPRSLALAAALVAASPMAAAASSAPACMIWSAPEVIRSLADGRVDANYAVVGMDGAGRAILLYSETSADDPTEETVFARHRSAQGVWGDPVPVWLNPADPLGRRSSLELSVGSGGHALVSGRRFGNGERPTHMAAYDPNTGWQAPVQPLDPGNGLSPPTVAMAPNGRGLAAWPATTSYRPDIRARAWTPATGWGPDELVPENRNSLRTFKLAINARGQALLTYSLGRGDDVYARFRNANGGWGRASKLSQVRGGPQEDYNRPQPALNAAGDAWVTWSDRRGRVRTVMVNSFDRHTRQWLEAPVPLSTLDMDAEDPVLRLNEQGQVLVGWHQTYFHYFHDNKERIQTRLYTPTQGWGPTNDLNRRGRSSGTPGLALDEAGNATTVWPQITPNRGWHLHTLAQPVGEPALSGRLHANGSVAKEFWLMADGEGRHAIVVFIRQESPDRLELVSQIGQLGDCPP